MDVSGFGAPLCDPASLSISANERALRSSSGLPSHEVAEKFEALFATMLVKEMRKALPEGFFGSEADGDIYAGWLDQHLGQAIARRGDLHLAPIIEAGIESSLEDKPVTEGDAPWSSPRTS